MQNKALINRLLTFTPDRILGEIWIYFCGLLLMICLAQIAIPLPLSPVPFTGQTFGCLLIALSWGGKRAPVIVFSYLTLGAIGAPVFAYGSSGLAGPTAGYLIGMLLASFLLGYLADRGWSQTFKKAFTASIIGLALIFTCGLAGLSLFLPASSLLQAGLLPFIPGDLLKAVLASYLVSKAGDILSQ